MSGSGRGHVPVPAATPVFEAGKHPRAALPPHHRSVSWPQATLADAAGGTGLITVPPEADGIMRRMPTVAWVGSVLIPSFDVEVERLLASVIAIAAMLQFGRIGDKAYTLLCGSAVILLGGGSFGAFATAGLLLDATLPVATLLGTNPVVLAERIHQEVRMRRRTEGELTNALREAELRTEAEIARESLAIALDAAMKTGALHFQCRIRRQDGSLASIVVDGRVYHSEDGTPTRIAGVVADVTERRRIEEVLQQTQRLQAVGTIAGGVAHNFNNLLAIVLGNLDLASRPSSDIDRVRPYLAAATAAAERGARLTWQLLSFARQQPIAPSEQLRNLAILIGETFPANIRIETAIPRDLWGLEIDLGELQLALLNLGFNARDAMPSGGLLRISAKNQAVEDDRLGLADRYVLIELADTGLGIPREILPRVFEPFMTTKEVGAGSGLGLSQVHGFVHQSGGAVDIESEPGTGTVVRMYLPVANVPTAGTAFTAPEAAYRATGSVLVVEDQPVLADLAAQLFGQWQLEIKVVHQANTALAMLREGQKIDLVFADIMMADGMVGLELAETMKNEFPDIPILLTSGYTDVASDAVTRGFQVIRKPYRMEELGMWLQRLLGIRST
jgi:signal transduction histidine kinase